MLFITSFGGDSDDDRTIQGPSLPPNLDKPDKWSVFIVVFMGTSTEYLRKLCSGNLKKAQWEFLEAIFFNKTLNCCV